MSDTILPRGRHRQPANSGGAAPTGLRAWLDSAVYWFVMGVILAIGAAIVLAVPIAAIYAIHLGIDAHQASNPSSSSSSDSYVPDDKLGQDRATLCQQVRDGRAQNQADLAIGLATQSEWQTLDDAYAADIANYGC